MKTIIAYALITNRGGLALYNHQLPLYWRREVAERESEKYNKKVIEVVVSEVTNSKSK